jgi:RecA/RadA recombinase
MKLKNLNCHFLNECDLLQLNLANIHSVEQFVSHADLEQLSNWTKVSLSKLKMLKKYIIGHYAPFPQLASELMHTSMKHFFSIEFNCKQLDEMTAGGVYAGQIAEIQGATATGKTQLCMSLVASMLRVNMGSHGRASKRTCLYVDSNRSFCPRRLCQLINIQSDDEALKCVKLVDCKNVFHLFTILSQIKKHSYSSSNQANSMNDKQQELEQEQQEETIFTPNLLIIDNLTYLFNMFRPYYMQSYSSSFSSSWTSALNELNYYISYLCTYLKYLATTYNMAVVIVTNTTPSSSSGQNSFELGSQNAASLRNLASLVISLTRHETKQDNTDTGNILIRMAEVVKCSRPFIKNSAKIFSQFRIDDSGIS